MSSHRKILILSIARPRRQGGEASPAATYTDFCPRPTFVAFLAVLLRLIGFRFATVSDALKAPFGRFVCFTFDGASPDIHRVLFPRLRSRNIPATLFVPTKAVRRAVVETDPEVGKPERGLTWEQLRQLVKHGWEVGSLGHEPVDLTERSYLEQRRQIARSRFLITARLGRAPRIFSYPFGAYDATTMSCVKEQGFDAAVTMRKGTNHANDAFQLHRVPLGAKSVLRDLAVVLRHALSASPAPAEGDMKSGAATSRGAVVRTGAGL